MTMPAPGRSIVATELPASETPQSRAAANQPAERLAALRLSSDGRLVRIALCLLLVPTLWFTVADFSLSAGKEAWLAMRLTVRGILVIAIIAAAWLMGRTKDREGYERHVLWYTLVAATCLVALNVLRPPGSGLPLRTPLLWLFAFFAAFPSSPRKQFAAPFMLTAGLLMLPAFWDSADGWTTIAGNLLVLGTMNTLGALLVFSRHQLTSQKAAAWAAEAAARTSAEAALRKLKILQGIIPICAHCRNVRTEVGSWQMLESYVRAHSDAEFSHGICPACLKKHYPEF